MAPDRSSIGPAPAGMRKPPGITPGGFAMPRHFSCRAAISQKSMASTTARMPTSRRGYGP